MRPGSDPTDVAIATWLTPPVRKALLAIARVDPAHLEIDRGVAWIAYSFGIEDKTPLRQAARVLALLREAEVVRAAPMTFAQRQAIAELETLAPTLEQLIAAHAAPAPEKRR